MKRNPYKAKKPPNGRLLFLTLRYNINRFLDILFFFAKWDQKLRLGWLRSILIPVMLVPMIAGGLEWLMDNRQINPDELLSGFPLLYYTFIYSAEVLIWVNTYGLMPFIFVLFALGFLRILMKMSEAEKQLGMKLTKIGIAIMGLDFIMLLNTIKYLTPFLQTITAFWVFTLIITSIPYWILLRKYQRDVGPFNPEQELKREIRKMNRNRKKKARWK